MKIGDVAAHVGMAPRTIRFYETCSLIEPTRSENGYREFSETDILKLQFLARARRLGFSLAQCRELLALWANPERTSADVKALAERRLQEIEDKLKELDVLKETIRHLVAHCHGDDNPDCPIIDELAGNQCRDGQESRRCNRNKIDGPQARHS